MSRTFRHRGHGRRFGQTREAFVADAVARALRFALAFRGVFVRVPDAERVAAWNASVDAYHADLAAWETQRARLPPNAVRLSWGAYGVLEPGRSSVDVLLDPPPPVPYMPSKRRKAALTDEVLAAYLADEADKAGRAWDRVGRDGGSHRRQRRESSTGMTRKQLRAATRQACHRALLNTDAVDDGTWHTLLALDSAFPHRR